MENLIIRITQLLVDNPDQVSVKKVEGDRTIVFELRAAKEDLGKIIGKRGRNVEALRTIISATSAKEKKRCVIEIVDEERLKSPVLAPKNMFNERHQKISDQDLPKNLRVGIVKWFNSIKGYGFIAMDDGNELFVHHSSIKGADQTLAQNDQVTFEVIKTDKGLKAINVNKTRPREQSES